jgi:hypothetical protein
MISSTLAGRPFGPVGKSESARPNLEVRSAKSGRRSAPGLPRRPGDGNGNGRPNGAKTVCLATSSQQHTSMIRLVVTVNQALQLSSERKTRITTA